MPFMRHKPSAPNFRAVRGAGAHGLGNHTDRQALQLRQNVAPEIHAFERSIIAPYDGGGFRGSSLAARMAAISACVFSIGFATQRNRKVGRFPRSARRQDGKLAGAGLGGGPAAGRFRCKCRRCRTEATRFA
jgi:hypothetical protein